MESRQTPPIASRPSTPAAASSAGDAPPFLDPDVPHWAARGLAYILILLFTTALVGAAIVRVPEAVSCQFVLLPMRGTDPIRAPRRGVVGEVRASPALRVGAGEPVFIIRSQDVGARAAELRTLETALDGNEKRLGNERREHASQALADDQERRRLESRIAYLANAVERKRTQLAMVSDLAERFETAYREGIASWLESVSHSLKANRTGMELAEISAEETETRTALEKLRHESAARDTKYAELDRALAEEMEKGRIRIGALRQELVHTESDELAVPAPCAGTVLRLVVNGVGAYVHEGDVLCEIACSNERLQAELIVPESGVGRIRPGQGVKLLYDAFPYQRYGIKYGTVRWVSPSSVAGEDGRRFRVLADIDSDSVRVDGHARALVAGMGGTARVVVGRRTVISAAFAPLRQLQEAFDDAPDQPPVADLEGMRSRAD